MGVRPVVARSLRRLGGAGLRADRMFSSSWCRVLCRRRCGRRWRAGRSGHRVGRHGVGRRGDSDGWGGRGRRWRGDRTRRNRRRGAGRDLRCSMHERARREHERERTDPACDREDDGPRRWASPTRPSGMRRLLRGRRVRVENMAAVRGRGIALDTHVRVHVREVDRPFRRRRRLLPRGWRGRLRLSSVLIRETLVGERHGLRRKRLGEDLSRSQADRADGHRRTLRTIDFFRVSHCSTVWASAARCRRRATTFDLGVRMTERRSYTTNRTGK